MFLKSRIYSSLAMLQKIENFHELVLERSKWHHRYSNLKNVDFNKNFKNRLKWLVKFPLYKYTHYIPIRPKMAKFRATGFNDNSCPFELEIWIIIPCVLFRNYKIVQLDKSKKSKSSSFVALFRKVYIFEVEGYDIWIFHILFICRRPVAVLVQKSNKIWIVMQMHQKLPFGYL